MRLHPEMILWAACPRIVAHGLMAAHVSANQHRGSPTASARRKAAPRDETHRLGQRALHLTPVMPPINRICVPTHRERFLRAAIRFFGNLSRKTLALRCAF